MKKMKATKKITWIFIIVTALFFIVSYLSNEPLIVISTGIIGIIFLICAVINSKMPPFNN